MTELQMDYVDRRAQGTSHRAALRRTAAKYGLTADDVENSLKRAEKIEETGFFALPGRRQRGKR